MRKYSIWFKVELINEMASSGYSRAVFVFIQTIVEETTIREHLLSESGLWLRIFLNGEEQTPPPSLPPKNSNLYLD